MAIGDDALDVGYPLVPPTGGDDALIRWGSREINRTRDFVAQVLKKIPSTKAGFRAAAGISSGTAMPTGGDPGDIYYRIVG